jgi:hypothetical protein
MNHASLTPAVRQAAPNSPGQRPRHALTITRKKLRPGQAGAKKLFAEYGEKLVCVRYRYDAANKRRIKTVELAIDEAPWEPPDPKIHSNPIMHLRIKYGEVALGKQVKAAGGKWNREKHVWELPYDEVLKLGLSERIVDSIKN